LHAAEQFIEPITLVGKAVGQYEHIGWIRFENRQTLG